MAMVAQLVAGPSLPGRVNATLLSNGGSYDRSQARVPPRDGGKDGSGVAG